MIKTKFLGVLMVLLATLPLSAYASHFVNLEGNPGLRSASAFVTSSDGNVIYGKDIDTVRPIASLTKLMTAIVILDSPRPIVTCYNSQDPAWNMAHPCPGVK
jgi:D-alanyl-D-alanine endopeptidase (penicillin-binding protein 7)